MHIEYALDSWKVIPEGRSELQEILMIKQNSKGMSTFEQ